LKLNQVAEPALRVELLQKVQLQGLY